MARRVNHLDRETADRKAFAIGEQAVEIAAVGFQIRHVEDRPENALHVANMFANADLGARLGTDVRRTRQMIGMGMGFQHPIDDQAKRFRPRQNGIDRAVVDFAGLVIVIEDRVDDRAMPARRVPDEIADRIGRLIEESLDLQSCVAHVSSFSISDDTYIAQRLCENQASNVAGAPAVATHSRISSS